LHVIQFGAGAFAGLAVADIYLSGSVLLAGYRLNMLAGVNADGAGEPDDVRPGEGGEQADAKVLPDEALDFGGVLWRDIAVNAGGLRRIASQNKNDQKTRQQQEEKGDLFPLFSYSAPNIDEPRLSLLNCGVKNARGAEGVFRDLGDTL